jgi:hypothetical protein
VNNVNAKVCQFICCNGFSESVSGQIPPNDISNKSSIKSATRKLFDVLTGNTSHYFSVCLTAIANGKFEQVVYFLWRYVINVTQYYVPNVAHMATVTC